jgi:RND family efflux transporter MFP subunit
MPSDHSSEPVVPFRASSAPHAAPTSSTSSDDEEIGVLPGAPTPRRRTIAAVVIAVTGLLTVLFLVGLLPRLHRDHKLRTETTAAAEAKPRVNAAPPRRIPVGQAASLPGSIEPLRETTVFARTSGYVKRRLVDIGDKVTEGQLLAELETPEIQQDLLQAQASLAEAQSALAQAKTSLGFARTSLDRSNALVPEGLASQQDLDLKKSAFDTGNNGVRSAEATIRSREATVHRLMELTAFAKVTAPFAGTVTSRTIEVGALVTAGNGAGQAMFKVAEIDTLRVFVSVPQVYAPLVRVGEEAKVSVREYPGRAFPGTITRAAGALDPSSRTMLTQIEVPNKDHALLPGMYAQASLHLAAVNPPLLIPASSLVFGAEGTAVLVVGPDQRVRRKKIVIEGDYGADLGIAEGIDAADRVISNPSERLAEGLEVEVVVPPAPASAAPTAPPPLVIQPAPVALPPSVALPTPAAPAAPAAAEKK